jgi:hypothetical protein
MTFLCDTELALKLLLPFRSELTLQLFLRQSVDRAESTQDILVRLSSFATPIDERVDGWAILTMKMVKIKWTS